MLEGAVRSGVVGGAIAVSFDVHLKRVGSEVEVEEVPRRNSFLSHSENLRFLACEDGSATLKDERERGEGVPTMFQACSRVSVSVVSHCKECQKSIVQLTLTEVTMERERGGWRGCDCRDFEFRDDRRIS